LPRGPGHGQLPAGFFLRLTIHNASSSRYTLTAMTYVALAVPLVVAYIAYVWHLMDRKKVTVDEVETNEAGTTY